MINLLKILKFKGRPEPKFNPPELVIYNESEKPGDKLDELYLIDSRRFGVCTDCPIKQWYYNGIKLSIEETLSKGVPRAPFYRTGTINMPEEHLHKLDKIRIKFVKKNKANLSEKSQEIK